MAPLDAHLSQSHTNARTVMLHHLPEGEELLWAGYQRPTIRLLVQLISGLLTWCLLFVFTVWFTWNSWEEGRFWDGTRLAGDVWLMIAAWSVILIGIGIPLWRGLYRRVRYPKRTIYGFTARHAFVLHPWQEIQVEQYDLAQLAHLKVFARTDGTFNASYLVKKWVTNSAQDEFDTEYLFLDAIGNRGTAQLLQQAQRAAKAAANRSH